MEKKQISNNILIFYIIIILVTAFIGILPIDASNNYLTISLEGKEKVGINEEYVVEVKVSDLTGALTAINNQMDYDREYLELISAEGIYSPFTISYIKETDRIFGLSMSGDWITSDCTIMTLKFKPLKAGITTIGFLKEEYSDEHGNTIKTTKKNKTIEIIDKVDDIVTFETKGRQYFNLEEEATLQINVSKIIGDNIVEIYGKLDYQKDSVSILSVEPASNNIEINYNKDTNDIHIKSNSTDGISEGSNLINVTLKSNESCNGLCFSHIIIEDPLVININNYKINYDYNFFMFMYTPKPEYTLGFNNSGNSNFIFGNIGEIKNADIVLKNSNGASKLKKLSGKIENDDNLVEIIGIDINYDNTDLYFNPSDKSFSITSKTNNGFNLNDIVMTIETRGKDMGFSRINIIDLEATSIDNREAIINCEPTMLVAAYKSETNIYMEGNGQLTTNFSEIYNLKVQNNSQYPIYKISGQFIYDKSKIHIFASDGYFDDKLIEFNEDTGEFTITKHNFEGFDEEEIIFDFYVLAKNISGPTDISINNIKALDIVEREMTINSQVKTISIN